MQHVRTVRWLTLAASDAALSAQIAEIDARLPGDRAVAECHRRGLLARIQGVRSEMHHLRQLVGEFPDPNLTSGFRF